MAAGEPDRLVRPGQDGAAVTLRIVYTGRAVTTRLRVPLMAGCG